MKIIHSLSTIPESARGAVIALGNFDGLHLGHRAILEETLARAKELSAPAAVMTFEPHPRRFFAPDSPHLRLLRLKEKISALRDMGFDIVFIPRFDATLAATSAEDFMRLLQDQLAVRYVVTGENFRFGTKRSGNSALLAQQTFGYTAIAHIEKAGKSISSTAIRECLSRGDIAGANALLGYSYRICGHVTHGDKRGRTLGFPTANIPIHRFFVPRMGVYKVRIQHSGFGVQEGVMNIGVRPTFSGLAPRAEIHLLDFTGDLYGHYMRVEPLRFLRDEMKFSSQEQLKAQILRDIEMAGV